MSSFSLNICFMILIWQKEDLSHSVDYNSPARIKWTGTPSIRVLNMLWISNLRLFHSKCLGFSARVLKEAQAQRDGVSCLRPLADCKRTNTVFRAPSVPCCQLTPLHLLNIWEIFDSFEGKNIILIFGIQRIHNPVCQAFHWLIANEWY